jgi:hypothetical protein
VIDVGEQIRKGQDAGGIEIVHVQFGQSGERGQLFGLSLVDCKARLALRDLFRIARLDC